MAQCQVCRASGGSVMKKCGSCGETWCASCARQGKGHYPKTKAANICPYCGARKVIPVR